MSHYDELVILPGQFNYRAFLELPESGWLSVPHLDGARIHHNQHCIELARTLGAVKRIGELDAEPLLMDGPVHSLRRRRPYPWVAHRTGKKDRPLVAG